MKVRPPLRKYDSVQQDWRAFLPEAKSAFFYAHANELENAYLMLSVALDDALALWRRGQNVKAKQTAGVTPELCGRLVLRLSSVLHAMRQQARHFGIVPNLAPLEVANFRTDRAQRAARFSSMMGHVLLSERSQFIQKISALEQIVEELGDFFVQAVGQADRVGSEDLEVWWRALDAGHFDLNTALRETLVLFKSFLVVLPEEQLDLLDFTIRGLSRARPTLRFAAAAIEAGRIAAVAGK
jgi:exonuclease VII small subunit